VLLRGPKTPDSQAIKLALKELVVRRHLRIEPVQKRSFLSWKRSKVVFVQGSSTETPCGQVLQAVNWVFESARLESSSSLQGMIEEHLAEMKTRSGGGRLSLRDAFRIPETAHVPLSIVLPDGTTGVPLDELAAAVMRKYRKKSGAISTNSTRTFVQSVVFPSLERWGLAKSDGTLTVQGSEAKIDLQALTAEANLSIEKETVSDWLRAQSADIPGIDALFRTIDKAVDQGWNQVYGD